MLAVHDVVDQLLAGQGNASHLLQGPVRELIAARIFYLTNTIALPSSLVFHTLFDAQQQQRQLLFFLSRSSLYCVDFANVTDRSITWPMLVTASDLVSQRGSGNMSKEEVLLRERQRSTLQGITSFQVLQSCTTHARLLLSTGRSMFVVDFVPQAQHVDQHVSGIAASGVVFVREIHTPEASLCPHWNHDGSMIAFTSGDELWATPIPAFDLEQVHHIANQSSATTPATPTPTPTSTSTSPSATGRTVPVVVGEAILASFQVSNSTSRNRTAGTAEYIMQEEFDRYHGFWWSPTTGNQHHVLYFEVDSKNVHQFNVANNDLLGTTDSSAYPLAGGDNASTIAYLATLTYDSETSTWIVSHHVLQSPLHQRAPWAEYVPRAGWKDERTIWLQLLDRQQQVHTGQHTHTHSER
jgi:hypothetical protein